MWSTLLRPLSGLIARRKHSNAAAAIDDATTTAAKSMYGQPTRPGEKQKCLGKDLSTITTQKHLQFIFCSLGNLVAAWAAWVPTKERKGGSIDCHEITSQFPIAKRDGKARIIEETINSHPMVAELRQRPGFIESRPHMNTPSQRRTRSLTGTALNGPGRLPVPPYAWTEDGGKSLVSVVFVGKDLCSYPGVVHGGFLATMLDEGLARCCFGALPYHVGVTANLSINYRMPTPTESYLVVRAETTKVHGRKAWVKGQIESLPASGEVVQVYAEAEALFISPNFAASLPEII